MENKELIEKAKPFFEVKKERENIFATADGQMFDEMVHARNHAVSNKLGAVVEITRSQIETKPKKTTTKKDNK